eukprot:UN07196
MRSVGQLGIFVLSLLMFPVARNSVLLSFLGISYESSLTYHKIFGGLFMFISLAHVIAVFFVYMEESSFIDSFKDIIWPFPVRAFENQDNFTIPVATYTTMFAAVTIGIFALYEPFRRNYYRIFMYFTSYYLYYINHCNVMACKCILGLFNTTCYVIYC